MGRFAVYPYDMDTLWLASDAKGQLAGFTTAGVGPIPELILSAWLEETEELINKHLPVSSQAKLLVALKRPDDYVALAERGLFVYDWSDVHRPQSEARHTYELIAVPNHPAEVSVMSEVGIPLASVAAFPIADFAAFSSLSVRQYGECLSGYL